jgi:protein-tyrosine-phosphatase
MAEYMFRRHLESYPGWQTCSAGVMTGYGTPASRFAVKAVKEIGIDLRPHRSQPVSPELVDDALIIVVMTSTHRDILCERFPDAESKVKLLKEFDVDSDGGDVMDPIGLSLDVYKHVRDEIDRALWGLDAHVAALESAETD